jgi:hypothetical protein
MGLRGSYLPGVNVTDKMNERQTAEKAAREWLEANHPGDWIDDDLSGIAALIATREQAMREQCAKVAELVGDDHLSGCDCAADIATAIRALTRYGGASDLWGTTPGDGAIRKAGGK